MSAARNILPTGARRQTTSGRRCCAPAAPFSLLERALCLLCIVGCASLGRSAAAPSAPDELEDLHMAQEALRRPLPAAERETAIVGVLEARRLLLEARRDDPRCCTWLADQAFDVYSLLLPLEASSLFSLYGVPTPPQLARAREAARLMHELAVEAEARVERALLDLEARPGYAGDVGAQMARRRLAEEERDRRIPFLRGIGAFLHARLNAADEAERVPLLEIAAAALLPLCETLPPATASQARLYAGLACADLGRVADAAVLLEGVASDPSAAAGDVFAAHVGLARVAAARRGPDAGLAALRSVRQRFAAADEPLYALLLADGHLILTRQKAAGASDQERALLEGAALEGYLELLERADHEAPQLRPLLLQRLAYAVRQTTPLERLPPVVTIAFAGPLAGAQETAPQAALLLEGLLMRPGLASTERADALFALGRAHLAAGRDADAAQHFLDLARELPQEPLAERSIELAAAVATQLRATRPGDAAAAELAGAALSLLVERYPNLPSVDRWRFEAGRLALAEGRHAEALRHFESIPPDAAQWPEAQLQQARVLLEWARVEPDSAARVRRLGTLLEFVERLRPLFGGDRPRARELAVCEASAHLGLGRPQKALDALHEIDPADDPAAAAAILVRIEALFLLERPQDVRAELERLRAAAGGGAGRILLDMLQARMRQVRALAREDRDEEASALARRHLPPLAEALRDWAVSAAGDSAAAGAVTVAIADAWREAGRPELAGPLYDQVLREQPDALEALLGRAECLLAAGEGLEEAMAIYRRIGSQTAADSVWFWQSHLRMLQILRRTGRSSDRIAAHVELLRRKDPELGGAPFRGAFESLLGDG
jgi:hypothetical protein